MVLIVVVGAGIVGASVAYHLAVLGVPVTLVDRAAVPAAGVTGGSFGWIGDREGGDWPGGAEDLRRFVRADHRRLEDEVAGVAVRRTGCLSLTDRAPGGGARWAGRDEIARLEPHLADPPERAVWAPGDAGVDPVATTRALVRAAAERGARTVLGVGVTALRVARGRVEGVETPGGFLAATTVVLAAGTGVPALAAPIGVRLPVAASPALLVRAAVPAGLVRTVVVAPGLEARELRPGEVLMTAPLRGASSPADLRRRAEEALGRLRALFPGDGPYRLLGCGAGARPMPVGGPLIGPLTADRSAYAVVMHSGVTLAPTAGRLVAREISSGRDVPELGRCRPGPG